MVGSSASFYCASSNGIHMNIDKGVVLIVILSLLYVLDVMPRLEEYDTTRTQLLMLRKQLAQERLFGLQRDEIGNKMAIAVSVHQSNLKRLYPSDMTLDLIMNQLQDVVRQAIQKNGMEMVNLRWGEPFKRDKNPYSIFPLSIVATGTPPNALSFLEEIYSNDKFVSPKLITITRNTKDKISLDMIVNAYPIPGEVQ